MSALSQLDDLKRCLFTIEHKHTGERIYRIVTYRQALQILAALSNANGDIQYDSLDYCSWLSRKAQYDCHMQARVVARVSPEEAERLEKRVAKGHAIPKRYDYVS